MTLSNVTGCDDDPVEPDAGTDAGEPVDAGPAPVWPGTLPATTALGDRRGRTIARSTIHLHSPLSHDACDGDGWVDGALGVPECLEHFRNAICELHLDAVMITDHSPHVNEVAFEDALWIRGDDEPVVEGGETVANRMACPDGHRALLTVGSENTLMPLALSRHPADPSDPDALGTVYDTGDAATFRAAGGVVWQAHTEGVSLDDLRARDLDGLELYNLHANLDPRIREAHLGLDPAGFLSALLEFADPDLRLPGNLAVLTFIERNQTALDRWDALLAEGSRIAGSGGCDAHENALPMLLDDGERADGYRRSMLFIQNHLLVDEVSPAGVREALDAGRLYVTHEIFGSPVGFDFVAEDAASTFDMGDDAPVGATLRVTRPSLPADFPSEPAPTITIHILRSTADGGVEVAMGDGPELTYTATEPGPYRAEVRMVPEHTRPMLGARADRLIREVTWVYSNPIFVVAP